MNDSICSTKIDDGPTFFGDGNLAGTPKPSLTNKGIRRVIKVVDDQFLYVNIPPILLIAFQELI